MKTTYLRCPFRDQIHFYEVVLLPGVTYEENGCRILEGDVFVFEVSGEEPLWTWNVFVSEDSDFYLRSDALWHRLCNVAITEAVHLIYLRLGIKRRLQKERESREVAASEPETRAKRGKKILVPRLSILRNEKTGMRMMRYSLKSETPSRFRGKGSGARFACPKGCFPLPHRPARFAPSGVQSRPVPQSRQRP